MRKFYYRFSFQTFTSLVVIFPTFIQAWLPPLNFSLQPAALFLWLRSGSWLTPTRGDPDCHVTERSWLGKGERAISRARSINWGVGAAGPAAGWIRGISRPTLSRFPLPASRSTLNVQGPRFTVYGWESEQGHCPAEGHEVQPRGSAWHGRAGGWEGAKDPLVQSRTRI